MFIFSVFTAKNAPKMSMAKVIHAGWSNCDSPNLPLLNAAQIVAEDSILLTVELKATEREARVNQTYHSLTTVVHVMKNVVGF